MSRFTKLILVGVFGCMGTLSVFSASIASADPAVGSQGTVVCGDITYNLISPDHAVTGSDLNGTSEVMLITDKAARFPQKLLTLCTAYPPPPDQPFTAYFFITPAS